MPYPGLGGMPYGMGPGMPPYGGIPPGTPYGMPGGGAHMGGAPPPYGAPYCACG